MDGPATGPKRAEAEQHDERDADDVLEQPDPVVRREGAAERQRGGGEQESPDERTELHSVILPPRQVPARTSSCGQFDPAATLRLVEEAGLSVLSHDVRAQLEGGRPVEFLWVLARKG